MNRYAIGAVRVKTHRVSEEYIIGDRAIRDVLQQQAEGVRAPVVHKAVATHRDVLRVHHGHTGLVVDKLVVVVIAVIGEHEVESVPKIPRRPIAGHVNSGRELEINPVPMAKSEEHTSELQSLEKLVC